MLKKQGNITWFSAVPLVNPQAGNASPQTASTSVPQAGSSWQDSASQAASASSPKQLVFKQSALSKSALPRQVVPGKTVLLRQLAPLPSDS